MWKQIPFQSIESQLLYVESLGRQKASAVCKLLCLHFITLVVLRGKNNRKSWSVRFHQCSILTFTFNVFILACALAVSPPQFIKRFERAPREQRLKCENALILMLSQDFYPNTLAVEWKIRTFRPCKNSGAPLM